MTCVVGLIEGDHVFIGADSAASAGTSLAIRSDSKVFRLGDFVIGFTYSYRMGQLIRYCFEPPHIAEDQDVFGYMVADFIPAVRDCLRDGGFMTVEKGVETGGQFLVGFKGRLFEIDSDFQVGERFVDFAAVGCGSDLALGSLFTSDKMPLGAWERIELALESAASFSTSVRAPFSMLSINQDKLKSEET